MEAKDFLKQVKTKKSKKSIFEEHKNDIIYLLKNDVQRIDILDFLINHKNLEGATYSNLCRYISHHKLANN